MVIVMLSKGNVCEYWGWPIRLGSTWKKNDTPPKKAYPSLPCAPP